MVIKSCAYPKCLESCLAYTEAPLGEKRELSNELVFNGYLLIGKPAITSVNKELKHAKEAEQKF